LKWYLFRHRGGNSFCLEGVFDSEKDALDFVSANATRAKGAMLVKGVVTGVVLKYSATGEWTDPRPVKKPFKPVPTYEEEDEEDDDED
jgi:hypothetical protein